ncbi:HEAT repeat domain-containing protein [Zeaxanthinibacter sp. PT1]|uniref:HEAT repeat domain-containing protein n=1 Tax=Zeaxanthinibacter TaxID=561554 RepID=UPI00234B913A|nr:HEAT repeat domain-containing protein [Zeaxanthinibacter sp. PT1]MDC6351537.1 HEAT repeat domain-containing protein [Zeaxanthinibacter sp. PT1]
MQAAIVPRYILNATSFHLELVGYFTVGFTVIALILLLIVFLNRRTQSNKKRGTAARKKILAPMISTFLFYENEGNKEDNVEYVEMKIRIREMLKDKDNRGVLTEILMDLQKDISGDAQDRLLQLYADLELHFDAFEKLSSWRWEIISSGILELSRMKVDKAYTFIRPFVNDRRSVIRKQAQIATVTLRKEGINYFLDTAKYAISEWQQLKLLDIIREKEDFIPPSFRLWLTSGNKDVVLFALRLIRYYKQSDANNAILRLLRHKNDQIKLEALECVREFCVLESLEILKKIYPENKAEIKRTILDTIGFLGSETEIPFLEGVIHEEKDFMVKSKAISSLNEIKPDSILPEDVLSKTEKEELTVAPQQEDQVEKVDTQENEPIPAVTVTQTSETPSLEEEVLIEAVPGIPPAEEMPVAATIEEPASKENISAQDETDLSIPDELPIEEEDLEIFDLCLHESLEELILEAREYEGTLSPRGVLSLDFLPLVNEPQAVEPFDSELSEDECEAIMHMETVYEILEAGDGGKTEEEQEDVPLDSLLQPHGIALKAEDENTFLEDAEAIKGENHIPELEIDFSPEPAFHLSIFSDLFLRCDKDTKLMLLDEILAVGDEKELEFLDFLLGQEEGEVLEKVECIREKLGSLLESFPVGTYCESSEQDQSSGLSMHEGVRLAVTSTDTEVDPGHSAKEEEGLLHLNFEPDVSNEESAEIVTGSFFSCIRRLMK